MRFQGKKILLGITGSIAAYKSSLLLRLLIREGAEVRVLMTPAAKDFVTPLTLSTLSKYPVLSDLFSEESWANHALLGRWADLMVVAPLSVNTLSKMASGQCDSLLLATWLSATCPVLLVPAMDEDMWHHPATRRNLVQVEADGNRIMPVGSGELASGLTGDGRMREPAEILHVMAEMLAVSDPPAPHLPLTGRKALVTAGPTYEAIDPVRFIGNHSSGKMGVAIAGALLQAGAAVELIIGPGVEVGSLLLSNSFGARLKVTSVVSAAEMFGAASDLFQHMDLAIMSAAVADYRPVQVASQKIKKKEDSFSIDLTRTMDILRSMGERKSPGQVLVGFALETENELVNAGKKLKEKNADLVVLNSLNDAGAGFGSDTNRVTIIRADKVPEPWPLQSKTAVAGALVNLLINEYYA